MVERDIAIDFVRDIGFEECFFKRSCLVVHAIEDSKVGIILWGRGGSNLLGNPIGFIEVIVSEEEGQFFAVVIIGPEDFREAFCIMGDDGVSGFKDEVSGSVILFEFNGEGIFKIFGEVEDMVNIRAAP